MTELLPERALVPARELDEYLKKHKKPVGLLHGLPISVKEYIGMKGLAYNAGFVAWIGDVVEKDVLMVEILRKAGCVYYVRTTEPQTLVCMRVYLCRYAYVLQYILLSTLTSPNLPCVIIVDKSGQRSYCLTAHVQDLWNLKSHADMSENRCT